MKKCPFCGADIEEAARFCLYCMQSLTEKEQVVPAQKKKPQWWLIIAAVLAAFLVLVLVLLGIPASSGDATPSDGSQPDSTLPSNRTEPSEPLHTHNYSLKNTAIEYQMEEATCTSPAIFYYSCVCGEAGSNVFSYGETKKHTIVTDKGYPASCTTVGLTDGTHCSVCNTVLSSQTQIPIVNHTYDNDQDEICNACHYVRVLNCDHSETVKLPAVSPTCIAGGLTEGVRCALCEEILTMQTAFAPLGHTEVIDQAVAPTCTADGKTEGKHCSACDTTLVAQLTVATKGHTEVIDRAVAPTCTVAGKTEGKHCSACDTILVAQVTVTAKGHTEVIDRAVAPTCTADGKTEGKHCSACNAILVAQVTVTAKGHTEVIDRAVAPTCTADGKTEGKHCSTCGLVLVYQQHIAALAHSFDPGNPLAPCLVCGAKSPHIHSYSVKNTAIEYRKEEATCLAPAVYYYSCICGKTGDKTFSSGETGEHVVITEPGYPATCDTAGLSEKRYCSLCQLVLASHWETQELGHTFKPGDSLPTCLVCGDKGTVIFQVSDAQFFQDNKFRIDGYTYTIRPDSVEEKWDITVSISCTNLSSSSATMLPDVSIYYYHTNGYWTGMADFGTTTSVQPGKSGIYMASFRVSNSSNVYQLRIS